MTSPQTFTQNPERAADEIQSEIKAKGGSLEAVHDALEAALNSYEASAGLPPESLLPEEARQRFLGRRLKKGASFLQEYSKTIGENLCKPGSALRRACEAGAGTTGSGLVFVVLTALSLPLAAVGVAAAIAGAIAALGIDAFCRCTESKDVSPKNA